MSLTTEAKERVVDFLLNTPLYEKIDDSQLSADVKSYDGGFDAFCPGCKAHSIFNFASNDTRFAYQNLLYFRCSRDSDHLIYFILRAFRNSIQKIGQFPSIADIHMPDLRKYSKVLPDEYLKEFTKAVGLATHGVGVGSFVYLRRIFESLIEESHQLGLPDAGWDEVEYQNARMPEKIKLLTHHLPSFLVENKALYGILSKGVHELSEQECLKAFPVVKLGIELILDEKLEQKLKQQKIAAASESIKGLVTKVQGGKGE